MYRFWFSLHVLAASMAQGSVLTRTVIISRFGRDAAATTCCRRLHSHNYLGRRTLRLSLRAFLHHLAQVVLSRVEALYPWKFLGNINALQAEAPVCICHSIVGDFGGLAEATFNHR